MDRFNIILAMSAGVFVLGESLLVYNIIRYRHRGNQEGEPAQKYGNLRLEFIWTAIPVLLVVILFVFTITTMNAVAAPVGNAKAEQADLVLLGKPGGILPIWELCRQSNRLTVICPPAE